jgi:large subunit ribosomal protein L7Ae
MVEIDEKKAFSIFQKAKESGKVKVGANEVTKAVERKQAKFVITATDVSPAEIVAHFEGLCSELGILYSSMGTKAELGALIGIKSTTALAVVDAGAAKKELDALIKEVTSDKKEAKEETKEEVKEESESSDETKEEE